MAEWMTIRVVLADGQGIELDPAPGRIMLAHARHTFAELAEAIDAAFGRWDPTPDHEFDVEGRQVISDPDLLPLLGPDAVAEDSEAVTLGDAGVRLGSRFTYLFDREQRWIHGCTVEEVELDPFALVEEEPDYPVPVFGWGDVPDQYGRIDEDDEAYLPEDALAELFGDSFADDDLEVVLDLDEDDDVSQTASQSASQRDRAGVPAEWIEPEALSWSTVATALGATQSQPPAEELRAAVDRLRDFEDNDDWPWDVLWAAAGLDDGELPDESEDLWLDLAAGVVVPRDAVPMDQEAEEAWASLEPSDWAGAVIGLVRAGPGQDASPPQLLRLIAECEEIDAGDLDAEAQESLLTAFATVVTLWQALGAVDEQGRLTALGRWGLPKALERAWT